MKQMILTLIVLSFVACSDSVEERLNNSPPASDGGWYSEKLGTYIRNDDQVWDAKKREWVQSHGGDRGL